MTDNVIQPENAAVGAPADLVTRIIARVIDGVLLAVVNAVVVATLLLGALFGGGGFFGLRGIVSSAISAAIYVGYFAFLESNRGQTLGKMLMKVQVVGPAGGHPTLEEAIKRNIWLAFSIVPFVGWLLGLAAMIYIIVTINGDETGRQGWHDHLAGGTRVVKVS
jgi:uncharacterized RDD family membrane protein YckC